MIVETTPPPVRSATHRVTGPVRATGSADEWSDALRDALADPGQPRIVFQPIVDLRRGVIAGYEALARFGTAAAPSPDLWFAAAERAGVAARFEARVLRAALAARERLPPDCFLSVNVMPNLLTTTEVASVWADADLSRLVLEFNETVSAERTPELATTIQALRERGGRIAMDDVGSGYAGLRQIARVHPDLVKLDRELVARADGDQVRRTLTELVNVFARRLDAWVIAEGIERDEELAVLVGLGVPLGQGWYLGRPAQNWQRLDPAVARRIRLLAQRTGRGEGVGSLLEQVRIRVGDGRPPHRGTSASSAWWPDPPAQPHHPGGGVGAGRGAVVVVNRRHQPVALQLPVAPGAAAARRVPASMVARPDEHIVDVARRAMSRAPALRFDPVVVVTELGRPVGLVRIERLMLRLAEMSGGRPRPPEHDRPQPRGKAPEQAVELAATNRATAWAANRATDRVVVERAAARPSHGPAAGA
ncbi:MULTISPECIES: EAL domain-containing protein [Protofrankia]|uniref:Diguanylate phosphodiesterase n=1 Tax=Candidatus Protofrankia datiscae TaxID=2716812 RepID=F8B511_9ACTN|nr:MULTISPECIES: EAL domain-containing protein [Protofrankia]AEH11033.1 diguanylate phosphodiesterase [Candidatus Protofrankia datiscae]